MCDGRATTILASANTTRKPRQFYIIAMRHGTETNEGSRREKADDSLQTTNPSPWNTLNYTDLLPFLSKMASKNPTDANGSKPVWFAIKTSKTVRFGILEKAHLLTFEEAPPVWLSLYVLQETNLYSTNITK